MNPLFWLLRMSRWARRPPSARQAAVVAATVALCLALAAIDHYFGWPAWLSVNPPLRGPARL